MWTSINLTRTVYFDGVQIIRKGSRTQDTHSCQTTLFSPSFSNSNPSVFRPSFQPPHLNSQIYQLPEPVPPAASASIKMLILRREQKRQVLRAHVGVTSTIPLQQDVDHCSYGPSLALGEPSIRGGPWFRRWGGRRHSGSDCGGGGTG